MNKFSGIDTVNQEQKKCPRCQTEIQPGETHCIRCGLLLDSMLVWMIERNQRKDGHLSGRIGEVSDANMDD